MASFVRLRNSPGLKKILVFTLIILIVWVVYFSQSQNDFQPPPTFEPLPLNRLISYGTHKKDSINIAISACGQDPEFLDQTLVLLKSTVFLTRSQVHFIILTDYMGVPIHHAMQNWPSRIKARVSYEIRPLDYTAISQEDQDEWKFMFKACSTQRLFIPKMFPELDAVLYIDADTLFMDDVLDLWDHFSRFDENQMAGLAEEFYHPTDDRLGFGHWKKWGEDGIPPIAGRAGLNAGVILMNLTRMRDFGWQDNILPVYREFAKTGLYADQGIINVIFHNNMDKLYTLPCRWNFWCDYCNHGICCLCESAQEEGVGLLHHTGFKWDFGVDIHSAMFGPYLNYNFEDDITTHLVLPLKRIFKSMKGHKSCVEDPTFLTKGLEFAIKKFKK